MREEKVGVRYVKDDEEGCSVAIVLDFIQTVWIFDP